MNDYLTSTKLVMPENLNPAGNLFGGQMMAWMDKVAGMLAFRVADGNAVTVKVSEINFKNPVHVGDQVEVNSLLISTGKTSMKIKVTAKIWAHNSTSWKDAADAEFIFVKIGEDGRPASI